MTSLNKQALREKFEAWAEEAGALPWGYLKKQRNASGNYSVQIYTYMWHAWSACHESLMDELEAAEKRIAEHRKVLNSLAVVARRYLPDYDEHPEIQAADELLESTAGIGVKGGEICGY